MFYTHPPDTAHEIETQPEDEYPAAQPVLVHIPHLVKAGRLRVQTCGRRTAQGTAGRAPKLRRAFQAIVPCRMRPAHLGHDDDLVEREVVLADRLAEYNLRVAVRVRLRRTSAFGSMSKVQMLLTLAVSNPLVPKSYLRECKESES